MNNTYISSLVLFMDSGWQQGDILLYNVLSLSEFDKGSFRSSVYSVQYLSEVSSESICVEPPTVSRTSKACFTPGTSWSVIWSWQAPL